MSFSQTFVSVEGSKYQLLTATNPSAHDTIITETSNSYITFSVTLPANTQYSISIGANLIRTKTSTGASNDTIKIKAKPELSYSWNVSNNFHYRIYTSNVTIGHFRVKNKINFLNVNSGISGNTINFTLDTLKGLNYHINNSISKSIYEYSFSQTSTPPLNATNLSTLVVGPLSMPITSSGTYYLHIRGYSYYLDPNETNFGLTFTGWITYSVAATYTQSTVGISENTLSNFKVYPNPAKDFITVQYTSANNIENVSLYNIAGQEMTTQAVESMGDNKVTFNLESYPQGIYFARIGSSTYKFIKQ